MLSHVLERARKKEDSLMKNNIFSLSGDIYFQVCTIKLKQKEEQSFQIIRLFNKLQNDGLLVR